MFEILNIIYAQLPEVDYLSEQLRHDFDLLAASEQWTKSNTGDSSHLNVVDDWHELVQQTQWQVGVLQAIDGQPTTRLFIAVLCRHNQRMKQLYHVLCTATNSSVETLKYYQLHNTG